VPDIGYLGFYPLKIDSYAWLSYWYFLKD